MSAALQIVTIVATFALSLLLGVIFDVGYFQAAIHAKETLADMPLPYLSTIFSDNHRALIYVMVFPWIGFAVIPLLMGSKRYFDAGLFFLRFAAFAAVESLLTVVLLLFLMLPFVPYYPLLEMRPNTITETSFIIGFAFLLIVVLSLIVRRALTKRAPRRAEQVTDGNPC